MNIAKIVITWAGIILVTLVATNSVPGDYQLLVFLAGGVIAMIVTKLLENRRRDAELTAKADEWDTEERDKRFELARHELFDGNTDLGVTMLEDLRDDCEEWSAPDDLTILKVCDLLADAHMYAERYDDSLDLHETNVAACRESLGWDHPFTLKCRVNLAHAYSMVDRHDEAIAFHEDALAGSRAALGADHPETLGAQGGLAWLLLRADRADEAIVLYEETLADCRRALGDDHYLTEDIAEKLDTTKEIVAEQERAP